MNNKKLNIKINNFLALLFCIILILNNSFFFSIQSVYYGILIFLWLLLIFSEIILRRIKITSFFVFYIFCLISIIINDIPNVIQPYQRFFIFFIMSSLLGPIFLSNRLIFFRQKVFENLNVINVIICSFSFILWALGIHNGQKMNEEYGILRPDFAGLYNHSMVLGPMAAIGVIYCYNCYKNFNEKRIIYLLLMILCLLTCFKAGSRNAILGLVICLPFYFYKISEHKVSKLFIFITSIIFILIVTYPLYESSLTFLFNKFNNSETSGSITSSRDSKWFARLQEFNDSPIFGVGYGNVTHEIVNDKGVVEPGSSWLAILSMTGVFGFIIFILNYFKFFIIKIPLKKKNYQTYYILSVMLFLSIYMIFEGVFLAAGTLMSAIIWLSLGLCTILKK